MPAVNMLVIKPAGHERVFGFFQCPLPRFGVRARAGVEMPVLKAAHEDLDYAAIGRYWEKAKAETVKR